jgi:hypothetical protein
MVQLSTARTKLTGDVAKITKKHFATIAGAILAFFTLINFHTISMTSCCDPANNCDSSKQGIMNGSQLRSISSSSSSGAGTLESTLLFLFDSIQPPHWKDAEFGEQYLNMKSVVNAYHRSKYIDKEDITLVTHGSIEKFSQLLDQVSQWQGPISFVMYLNNKADIRQFCSHMKTKVTEDFLLYVSIHVLLEKHEGTLPYPNNVLRNLAQRSIESNYFLLMDVDFIPSPGTYEYLKASLENDYFWTRLRNSTVFVLPAFELFSKDEDSFATLDTVPTTKEQLQSLIAKEEAATFHAYFPPGHYPTNYTKWFERNTEHEFSYPIEYMKRFEPYVIAYKRGIPDFWDGFRGFGFNAATWFWELNLAGYSFEVIRDYYLVHLNHPGRKGRNITDGSLPKLQLRRFMRYISRKYQVDQMKLRYWKGRKYGNGTHVSLVCESCK